MKGKRNKAASAKQSCESTQDPEQAQALLSLKWWLVGR